MIELQPNSSCIIVYMSTNEACFGRVLWHINHYKMPNPLYTYILNMYSLLTPERNFLSPDVQRRETICTPGKASLSCRQYDAEVDDKLTETMNEKENQNKEDSVAKVICHAQCSAKKKLLEKSPGSTCKKNPHVIVLATEIKSNSSFFNKDANTTQLNDMNATWLHYDSSGSEEDLNSKRRKKKRERERDA